MDRDESKLERLRAMAGGAVTFHGHECPKCGGTERYCCNANCRACVTAGERERYRARRNLPKSKTMAARRIKRAAKAAAVLAKIQQPGQE